MDRKSIIILAASFILLMLWYPLVVNKLYPPKPLPKFSTNAVPGTASTTATTTNTSQIMTQAVPAEAIPDRVSTLAPVAFTSPEQIVEFTNAFARYTFTSHGGGLKQIELFNYPEQVSSGVKKGQPQGRGVASLNSFAPVPALAILAGDATADGGSYALESAPDGIIARKAHTNGLAITKSFQASTNYLLVARVKIQNASSNTITLPNQDWVVGTATPMSPKDDGMAVGVYWYNGSKANDIQAGYFANTKFGCIPRTPPSEFRGGMSNVVWVAPHNQFFTIAAMPEQPAHEVVVQKVNLPQVNGEDGAARRNGQPPVGYIASMVYSGTTLRPGESVERTIHYFAGPKEYQTLARIGNRFHNNIDLVMGYGGFFGFFAKALLLAMNWFHDALKFSYGWAIVAITVIIKMVFWPLTAASTRSMKRLQALQPQMKAIQEKYKGDPAKMNRKTMEFMKEHKVSPLGGCLPMLLQIPVFFGFYMMIQSAIELRGADFLWVNDLSRPDTLFTIPGTAFPFNLLPLLMGVTMLWQARLTPPSPGMDPAQAKIMRYMPLMFMVFLYNFSAGLTLYWTVQNLLTIAQTKLTKTTATEVVPVKAPVLTAPQKKRK